MENTILKYLLRDLIKEDILNFRIQICYLIFDIPTFLVLFFLNAGYGKFYNFNAAPSFFPTISSRTSWIIQESPCVFITLYYLIKLLNQITFIKFMIILPFLIHYIHRTLIFPFIIHNSKNSPFDITLMAFTFCVFNSIIQNRSIFYFSEYSQNYIFKIQYLIGLIVFIIGMSINIFHDYMMAYKRKEIKEKGKYILPKGYLWDYISCPNYFGEMTEWFGFAILSGTFSGFIFFISTIANLFPRAIKYHNWYKIKFKEQFNDKNDKVFYRKAILPFVI